MNDSTHEEYERMKQWEGSQWYKGFDIEMVNRGLQYL